MNDAVRAAVEAALSTAVTDSVAVGGGSINDAYRVTLSDERTVFVKTNRASDPSMFPAEARGLAWLAEARALRVPEVVAVSEVDSPQVQFLVLEYLDANAHNADFEEALGRGLAVLHRFEAPSFGLDHDNFIGSLPQPNQPRPTWAGFYAEQRIGFMTKMARDAGHFTATHVRTFETLAERMDDLIGPPEPPARLHGDLWGGNLHAADGDPALIDPAVYGGHREVDLAMMRLFGGFGSRVFDAYQEAFPLAPGAEERVGLYQLYPLLVHVNLFGGSYVSSALSTARRYS